MAAIGMNKRSIGIAVAFLMLASGASPATGQTLPRLDRYRFEKLQFKVDDEIPLRDLLPTPPQTVAPGALNVDDLAKVPEVQFQEPIVVKSVKANKKLTDKEREQLSAESAKASRQALLQNAHQLAKIAYLNLKKRDLFMESLIENRPDLAGLPFMMGDACRLQESERPDFRSEVTLIRDIHDSAVNKAGQKTAERFWDSYDTQLKERMKNKALHYKDRFTVGSLMQVLGPESREHHLGLVPRLSAFGNLRATQALAKLAVFATDQEVRRAAAEALQKRDAEPATAVLLQGLRYPWPSVAQNSIEAIVQLKRVDLIPELVKMLEEPDPRAPVMREDKGKPAPVVRELVRINHLRNCMLCHAPGNTEDVVKDSRSGVTNDDATWQEVEKGIQKRTVHGFPSMAPDVVVGAAPTPGEAVPTAAYYSFSTPDILVRADVTYLRQDFSMLHKVADADPWPEMQRFDYLVRSRVLTESEAEPYRKAFGGDGPSPYRQAALSALRRLTGKDAGTTAAQWRMALGL